jgi:hypothetical protein
MAPIVSSQSSQKDNLQQYAAKLPRSVAYCSWYRTVLDVLAPSGCTHRRCQKTGTPLQHIATEFRCA